MVGVALGSGKYFNTLAETGSIRFAGIMFPGNGLRFTAPVESTTVENGLYNAIVCPLV